MTQPAIIWDVLQDKERPITQQEVDHLLEIQRKYLSLMDMTIGELVDEFEGDME